MTLSAHDARMRASALRDAADELEPVAADYERSAVTVIRDHIADAATVAEARAGVEVPLATAFENSAAGIREAITLLRARADKLTATSGAWQPDSRRPGRRPRPVAPGPEPERTPFDYPVTSSGHATIVEGDRDAELLVPVDATPEAF